MGIFARRLIWIVLLGCLLSACSAVTYPSAPAIAGGSERLDALILEYVDQQRNSAAQDPIFTLAMHENDIAGKLKLLKRLEQIPTDALAANELTDYRFLTGVLRSDIDLAKAQKRWETDPAMSLPSRELGLLLDPDAPESIEQRAVRLHPLLESLPKRLATARRELKSPPRRFTEAAIFQAQSILGQLTEQQPAFAGLDVTDTMNRCARELAQHIVWLENELLPRSDGNWALGREHYEFVLNERWHMQSSADEILMRGRKAFTETEVLAQEVAAAILPDLHWTEVYETLKDDHPQAGQIKVAYQQQMDAAQEFVITNRILTLPEGERVVTLDTPEAMRRSSPFGTFQTVSPFDSGLEGRLYLTPVEDWMSEDQQSRRLRSHHTDWIPIIAVHEAYPGHHAHALKTRENPRLLRRVAREPVFSEGWGLFTEELMFELGFLKGDEVRLTQLRNRLWRAARVILDVSLHTGQMSFDEAVDFLVEKVRFERYAAELEVGMYIRRPTYVLGYLIGMQDLMDIREAWFKQNGVPSEPREFYDRLLEVGSLPPALVRDELLQTSH